MYNSLFDRAQARRIGGSRRGGSPLSAMGASLAALTLLVALPLSGQERSIVSHEVAFSGMEAALTIEYANGEMLSISFHDQVIDLNGETVGSYESGSVLEGSWRSLLARAVALSDGPLAKSLAEWAPPEGLNESSLSIAQTLDRALETGVAEVANAAAQSGAVGEIPIAEVIASRFSLNDVLDILRDIDLDDDDLRFYAGRDLVIGANETIDGPVVVMDGTATIDGRIRGDLVVLDGDVSLSGTSEITGDLHLLDADLTANRGRILGSIRDIEMVVDRSVMRDQIRNELRDEVRREVVQREASSRNGRSGLSRWFRNALRGLGGALQGVIFFLVFTLIGGIVVSVAGDRLNTIADAARSDPIRAGAVGFAGYFLAAPVFILGIVALAVSIVGILAIPFWVILFPIAMTLASFIGFLSVCRNVGEWLSTTRYQITEWIRASNPYYTVTGGLAAFSLIFIVAHLLRIVPVFGALHGLVAFVGGLAVMVSGMVGLGAVLITRGGRFPVGFRAQPEEEILWSEDPLADRGSWEDADFDIEGDDTGSDAPDADASNSDSADSDAPGSDDDPSSTRE